MEKYKSEIQRRLFLLASEFGLSPNQFSIKIGRDRSYLHKIAKEVQSDALRDIFTTFPSANIVWIITGEGDMLLNEGDDTLRSSDASLLLRLFNEERLKTSKLEEEIRDLVIEKKTVEKERDELKEMLNSIKIDNVKLRQKLGIDEPRENMAG